MNFSDYQRETMRTAGAQEGLDALAAFGLGIAGEAGEVADRVKKELFHGHAIDHAAMKKELGDVLWYLSALACLYGLTLEEVAQTNIDKLRKRYPNGFSTEDSLRRLDEGGADA